jgi:D-alanyl-D-alanine carboxypeptidase
MLRLLMIACLFTLTSTSVQATPDLVPPVNDQKIQKILNNWRASSGIPGAALSIYTPNHDEPLTFASGTTQAHGVVPITKKTLFQAGSITKSFTSMIILKLEAEGKLNINDPITRYLPQYPQWNTVTIRQLLNHTSGIPNYTNTGQFNKIRKETPKAGFTPAQLVSMAGSRKLFSPGKGWKYSNTNYVLAGMIIEKVTGSSAHEIMDHYIHSAASVNLLNTYYFTGQYPEAYLSRMAHGYNGNGEDVTYNDMSWASTAGAIVTTSEDLLSWWYDLLQGKILPQTQLQKMLSLVCEGRTADCVSGQPIPHIKNGEVGYGYGLGIIQMSSGSSSIGPVWWHNGTTAGYRAIVMWFPKSDIYMALTINQGAGYLLKPTIPIIRNVMGVLLADNKPSFTQAVSTRVKTVTHRVTHRVHRHSKKPKGAHAKTHYKSSSI